MKVLTWSSRIELPRNKFREESQRDRERERERMICFNTYRMSFDICETKLINIVNRFGKKADISSDIRQISFASLRLP